MNHPKPTRKNTPNPENISDNEQGPEKSPLIEETVSKDNEQVFPLHFYANINPLLLEKTHYGRSS